MLGAAAVEEAVGLLISQKPLLGRWAPGSVCAVLLAGSAWQKACISGKAIPICVSRRSCRHRGGELNQRSRGVCPWVQLREREQKGYAGEQPQLDALAPKHWQSGAPQPSGCMQIEQAVFLTTG